MGRVAIACLLALVLVSQPIARRCGWRTRPIARRCAAVVRVSPMRSSIAPRPMSPTARRWSVTPCAKRFGRTRPSGFARRRCRALRAYPDVRAKPPVNEGGGLALFRVAEGEHRGYHEFADAKTIVRLNTRRVGRDRRGAAARRPAATSISRRRAAPDHLMVFVGASAFEPDGRDWVVYHTGPLAPSPSALRVPRQPPAPAAGPAKCARSASRDLLGIPAPRWRPVREQPGIHGRVSIESGYELAMFRSMRAAWRSSPRPCDGVRAQDGRRRAAGVLALEQPDLHDEGRAGDRPHVPAGRPSRLPRLSRQGRAGVLRRPRRIRISSAAPSRWSRRNRHGSSARRVEGRAALGHRGLRARGR